MSKPSDQPSGQPIGGQWAQQQKQGMAKQDPASNTQGTHRQLSDEEQRKLEEDVVQESAQQSDDDTPRDADGAGNPQVSRLEPEKGGIGGP